MRLANGYPTTEREAALFDSQKEQNEKNAEEFLKKKLAVCINHTLPTAYIIGRKLSLIAGQFLKNARLNAHLIKRKETKVILLFLV